MNGMTSGEVGVDDAADANRHFDMASSIGTYTTFPCSTFDESRSDKENSERHCDESQRIDVKGINDRYKASTLQESDNDNDADSSILSADFEDNDFDALVGEFFWYLREKEGIKTTPRNQRKVSVSTPDRTPRAMGSGKVLTPRNSEQGAQGEAHKPSARSNSLFQSGQILHDSKKVDHQKENVTRRASVEFKGLDNEDSKEVTSLQGNGNSYETGDDSANTSVQTEAMNSSTKGTKRLGIIPCSPSYNEDEVSEESEESSEGSSAADTTPGLNAGMFTQSTIELEDSKEISDHIKAEENVPHLDENASLTELKSQHVEINEAKGGPKMTPSRDDSWNEVWIRKGLMGRTPTPLKNMSSRVDESTSSNQDAAKVTSSSSINNLVSPPPCKVLKWPPPKSKEGSLPKSSSRSLFHASIFQGTPVTMTAEGNDEVSQDFDAEVELSRILDDDSSVVIDDKHSFDSQDDQQMQGSDDTSEADWELSRILDDSPCVSTIMDRSRDFIIERQKLALNENFGPPQAAISTKVIQTYSNHDSPKAAIVDRTRPPLPKNISIRIDGGTENEIGIEPESSFAMPSPYSIVAGTTSVVFDSLSPEDAVSGRDTPSNFVGRDISIFPERSLDPDGVLMDEESESSIRPGQLSISSRAAEPSRLDTNSGYQGNESVASDMVHTMKSLATPTMEPRLSFDDPPLEESDKARETVDSFEALSKSSIEKKTNSPQPSLKSNMTSDTNVVFESPSPKEYSEVGKSPKTSRTLPQPLESSFLFNSNLSSLSRQLSDPSDDGLPQSTTSSESSYSFGLPPPDLDGTEEREEDPSIPEDRTHTTETSIECDSSSVNSSMKELFTEESYLSATASPIVSVANSNQRTPPKTPVSPPQPLELPDPSNEQGNVMATTLEPPLSLPHPSNELGDTIAATLRPQEAPKSPPQPLELPKVLSKEENIPVERPNEQDDAIAAALEPHEVPVSPPQPFELSEASSKEMNIPVKPSNEQDDAIAATLEPYEAPTSPPQPMELPETLSKESSIPAERSDEQDNAIPATPEPKTSAVRKPSPRFNKILSQWKNIHVKPSDEQGDVIAATQEPQEAPTSPPMELPEALSKETSVPVEPSEEQDNAIRATPEPKTSVVRKPSARFNKILSQWKQQSDHKPNGHFLSPPTSDAGAQDPTPQFVSRTPARRMSTGQVRAVEFKAESSVSKWTPTRTSSIRRKSIDISSITVPNDSVSPRKRPTYARAHWVSCLPQDASAAISAQKTVKYWNGMIQKEGTPQESRSARALAQRESSEDADLMLTVPKIDSSASLSLTKSGSMVSAIDDDVPCTCTESAFSGNDDLREFFLPKLGMAHTCGKRNPPILIDSDPIGLHHILRPWQVDFLRTCDIYRGDQLVKACKNHAGSLAGSMRKWRLEHDMSCPRSVSCGMALHIWSRTCKYYVRTIRRQMADGSVEVEPPTLGDVMTTCQSKTESSFEGE